MRPALLVIIMDFLISSLLLFISGPGNLSVTVSGRTQHVPLEPLLPAAKFSPAAITAIEAQWQREYDGQMKDVKLLTQQKQLNSSFETNRALSEQKSGLESRIMDLRAELVQRQAVASNMAQNIGELKERQIVTEAELKRIRAGTESLAREKDKIAAGKADLEQTVKNLAEVKSQTEQKLKEAHSKQNKLSGQAETLHVRILAQAETISKQNETIARQQQTIGGDLKNVAQIQARIETKADALQQGQEQMQSALDDFRDLVDRLPQELRANVREIADDQKRIESAVASLARAAGEAKPANTDDRKLINEKMEALAKLQQELQGNVKAMSAAQTNANMAQNIQAIRSHQEAMRDQIGELVFKFDKLEIKQNGPYSRFKDSRLALRVTMMASKHAGKDAGNDGRKKFSNLVYIPLFIADHKVYAASHVIDLGFDWNKLGVNLKEVAWTISLNDSHPAVTTVQGPALVYPGDSRIIMLNCSRDMGVGPSLANLSQVKPVALTGIAALEKRGTRDIYVLKRAAEEAGFAVDISSDQEHPGYLAIRRSLRPWINFLSKHFLLNSVSRTEAGDYVVTAEGTLVGVMVDETRCCILSEEQMLRPAKQISLLDLTGFVRDIIQLRKQLP